MIDIVADAERILRECFAVFAELPNGRIIDDGQVFGVMTDVPITFFNGISTTRLDDAAHIDHIISLYRARSRGFRWWLTPSMKPANLEVELKARDFRYTYDANGMVALWHNVDFDVPVPRELTIRRVMHENEFDDYFNVFATTFQRPLDECDIWRAAFAHFGFAEDSKWSHYVGFVDDKPVSTTTVLHAGELAGIYNVATLPHARGRGIGRAVTLAAMKEGHDRGAARAVLQSSEMGFGVYRAIGFQDACELRLYDWRPEYESR